MKVPKDLTGFIFGRLLVLEKGGVDIVGKRQQPFQKWLCTCSCGKEVIVRRSQLVTGKTRSCGCLSRELRIALQKGKFKDITGVKYSQLTAVRRGDPVLRQHSGRPEMVTRWWWRCDCGKERLSSISAVKSGSIKDCGGHRGWSKHSLYAIWYGIKTRVSNPNQISFQHYGGRGIIMCPEWRRSFHVFVEYIEREIGPRPSRKHTLDRINNAGNYEPGNVRWATAKEQAQNKRPRKLITKFTDCEIREEFIRRNLSF